MSLELYFGMHLAFHACVHSNLTEGDLMKNLKRKFNLSTLGVFLYSSFMLLTTSAWAVPIAFDLGVGGTISYAGGDTGFTTTNGVVTSVGNGTTSLAISGGDLDFSTGNYTGGVSTASGFSNTYSSGGFVSITGDIGFGVTTLMQGDFSGTSVFNCCVGAGAVPLYASVFGGYLDVTYIDPTLVAALGFQLPAGVGALAQVDIHFSAAPTGSGQAFSGIQGGGAAVVTSSVPEPATLLLLGAGMIAFWGWRRVKEIPVKIK